jgi:acetyltransferase-like isoleucine patch superfamily enzyme
MAHMLESRFPGAHLADDVLILKPELVNIYGCTIGNETRIGPFVEIQRYVIIGCRCKISSHSFICSGVVIEDGVFIGHGVMFTNDRYPRAVTKVDAVIIATPVSTYFPLAMEALTCGKHVWL